MKNKKKKIIIFIVIILLSILGFSLLIYFSIDFKKEAKVIKTTNTIKKSPYRIVGNGLNDFDLYFLQLENTNKNAIYSPLSIKYALAMLNEGTNGDSNLQIKNIIGNYSAKNYTNSQNMSFANAMFIRNTFKENIKDSYTTSLKNKYNAEVVYDNFDTVDNVNNWVSNKTFKLVNNLFDSVSNYDFLLVNALAIDMEWKNKIQQENKMYSVHYPHEKYDLYVASINEGYTALDFNNNMKAKSVQIAASINKYDIVNTLGEANIRKTVGDEYTKWLASDEGKEQLKYNPQYVEKDVNKFLDKYIEELNTGYKQISSSTDFRFYDDENVKVFAKELKEYNATTLEYVGIMPKNDALNNYIKNINAASLNNIITKLKPIELDSFKEGVVTRIKGIIPMFNYEYELALKSDLNKLGVTDVFDTKKADLSKLTNAKGAFIAEAKHKANIEFSNEGIKAAAATVSGGAGATSAGFEYLYDVPIEEIDLTFDKPYIYLIRDKVTNEVWFVGSVYNPLNYTR